MTPQEFFKLKMAVELAIAHDSQDKEVLQFYYWYETGHYYKSVKTMWAEREKE